MQCLYNILPLCKTTIAINAVRMNRDDNHRGVFIRINKSKVNLFKIIIIKLKSFSYQAGLWEYRMSPRSFCQMCPADYVQIMVSKEQKIQSDYIKCRKVTKTGQKYWCCIFRLRYMFPSLRDVGTRSPHTPRRISPHSRAPYNEHSGRCRAWSRS